MPNKANVLCYSGLQLLTPSSYLARPARPSHTPSCRFYATTHDAYDDDFSWPAASSFTPYDLLKQRQGAPYSKSRFYDLVKIYHPDRPCNGHPLCKDISPQVRLRRYRLLVTANEILSDPVKRAAYDQFGDGWSLDPRSSTSRAWHPGMREYGPMYANATWEDWERWHNRHGPSQRQFVDHKTFVAFLILIALFGGTVNATWIGQRNATYEQKLREVNDQSSRFLAGRRENTAGQMKSSEARVQHFLIRRDPSGSGLKEEEQPVYDRILHPRSPITYNTEENGVEGHQPADSGQPG
jgi:curved DNA-binding protein CbpA